MPDDPTATALVSGLGDSPMDITAGGDLLITSQASEWAVFADFDISMPFIGADFSGLLDDFAETISRYAEEAVRKADVQRIQKQMRCTSTTMILSSYPQSFQFLNAST